MGMKGNEFPFERSFVILNNMQERRKERVFKILTSRYFFVGAIIVLFLLSLGVVKKMARDYTIDSEIDRLKAEVQALEKTSNEFSDAVRYLDSDRFIEDEARAKLGMQKSGESVIIITDNKKEDARSGEEHREFLKVAGAESAENEVAASNPELWWKYFFQS